MAFYPQLNPGTLNALMTIKSMMESDPDYLSGDDSPYDIELQGELAKLLGPKVIEKIVTVEVEKIVEKRVEVAAAASEGGGKRGPKAEKAGGNADVVDAELKGILEDLRNLKLNSKTLQPADKIQIIKTQAVLVEKMITMAERNTNIKKMSQFMSAVMMILDDLATDEQRQLFMKRLEPFADKE